MHATAHRSCTDTSLRESALEADSGRKIPCRTGGLEPASVSRLVFQSGTLQNELFQIFPLFPMSY